MCGGGRGIGSWTADSPGFTIGGHCGWPSVPPLADVSIGSVVRTPLDPGYVAAAGCVGILLTEHAARVYHVHLQCGSLILQSW